MLNVIINKTLRDYITKLSLVIVAALGLKIITYKHHQQTTYLSFIYLLIKSTHQQRACSTTGLSCGCAQPILYLMAYIYKYFDLFASQKSTNPGTFSSKSIIKALARPLSPLFK
jgi:hypothetical protein